MLVLYSTIASPPCRAVLMLKELLNLKMDIKEVNTIQGDHIKPEYLAKNPLHTVPLLEDNDFKLADSHAIMTYLLSKYGGGEVSQFYPSDLKQRALIDQRLYFDATILFPRFIIAFRSLRLQKLKAIPEDYVKNIIEGYGFLEKYLEATKFVAADHVTVADIACVATVSTLHSLVPIEDDFSRIHEWWNKMKGYEWYQKGNVEGLKKISEMIVNITAENRRN